VVSASGARNQADRLAQAVEETCRRASEEGFTDEEIERARKKLRYRYAVLADSRLDQAIALAESALWNFPTPADTERVVSRLGRQEIERAWRKAVAGRRVLSLSA
jgi:predicted Zn-dependent peptidase